MYTPPQLTIDHVISLDDDDTQTAACIVLVLSPSENISILYRACAVESGDFDSEPAMGTLDNCGFVNTIRFNDRDMRGCIVSCRRDGCNIAATYYVPPFWLVSVVSLVLARVAFVL
ncbi:hypothetical protein NP493_1387g00051 [Ridgeia piscesae]|uniref:Uncharacterized protein n=1 Tax=Ridgeia piscesae TaxID=27915 RepID=A0AAD9K5L7_RIDPI|nr:hypothetical protein NP493_1387g00051 [Ridgeia piscesae]